MKGQRKGVQLTRPKPAIEIKTKAGTDVPQPPVAGNKKMNNIFVATYDLAMTIHIDQTGKFPVTSQRGNRYIRLAST